MSNGSTRPGRGAGSLPRALLNPPRRQSVRIAVLCAIWAVTAAGATIVGSYPLAGNLNALEPGAPALVPSDPLGANAFISDTVFGLNRTVYAFGGMPSPTAQQAGLSFPGGGLLQPDNYSIEMVFMLADSSGYRRVLDVTNRNSDFGFYIDPASALAAYPVSSGSSLFTAGEYHHVVLTNDTAGIARAYLEGALEFATPTGAAVMNVDNPDGIVNFFLDNLDGAGLEEYSSGRVALIRLYNGVLTDGEVSALARDPFADIGATVPEPAAWMLMGLALAALPLTRKRR